MRLVWFLFVQTPSFVRFLYSTSPPPFVHAFVKTRENRWGNKRREDNFSLVVVQPAACKRWRRIPAIVIHKASLSSFFFPFVCWSTKMSLYAVSRYSEPNNLLLTNKLAILREWRRRATLTGPALRSTPTFTRICSRLRLRQAFFTDHILKQFPSFLDVQQRHCSPYISVPDQWRSQPKIFGGAKMFYFRRPTVILFRTPLPKAQND